MPKSDEVKIASRIPSALHRRIRVYCARKGMSLQSFVSQAVADYIRHAENKPQKRLDGESARA